MAGGRSALDRIEEDDLLKALPAAPRQRPPRNHETICDPGGPGERHTRAWSVRALVVSNDPGATLVPATTDGGGLCSQPRAAPFNQPPLCRSI